MPEPVRAAAAIFRASDHPEQTKAKVPSALLTLSLTGALPHELAAVAGAMASARLEIDNVLSYARVCLIKVRSQAKAEAANPPPVQPNGIPPATTPVQPRASGKPKRESTDDFMAKFKAASAVRKQQRLKEAGIEQHS